jgi:hypothetical protein
MEDDQPHCGPGSWTKFLDEFYIPSIVTGKKAQFINACRKHDQAYDTLGTSKYAADLELLNDLIHEANIAYSHLLDLATRSLCISQAFAMYSVVVTIGYVPYAIAQRKAMQRAGNLNPETVNNIVSNLMRAFEVPIDGD